GLTNTGNNGLLTLPGGGTFVNLSSPVSFRVHGYGSTGTAGGGGFEGTGDDLVINGFAVPSFATITTGTIANDAFCVVNGDVAATVPYTISGTYNAGNTFTALLSDENGDFTSPTIIGTVASTSAGNISAIIPAATTSGAGYRINVVASDPITIGTENGADLEVANAIQTVTAATTAAGNGQITLNWTAPSNCADQIVVLMSEGSPVNADFSQTNLDGLLDFGSYSANSAWDLRSDANDMHDLTVTLLGNDNETYVALAATASTNSVTVTGLTNGLTYYFRIFTIYNTNEYSVAVDLSDLPQNFCGKRLLITEYVEGASNDKCIEIYNADNEIVNLGNFRINVYSNGATTSGTNFALSSVDLAPGETWVVCNGAASATFLATADQTSIISHNGDDAIAIVCPFSGAILDVFGKIGQDPGAGWIGVNSGCSTENQIWRRNPSFGGALTGSELVFNPDSLYTCVGSTTDASDLGSFNEAFPVELLSFDSKLIGTNVSLTWATAMEVANDRFVIERKVAGTNFEYLGQVAGAGYSDLPLSYELIDTKPSVGENVYRLTQIDIDGTATQLATTTVLVESANTLQASLRPTLVDDKATLTWNNPTADALTLRLYSVEGSLIQQDLLPSNAGQNETSLSLQGLSAGMYFLHLSANGSENRIRFVKQ
ncbi:MAG: lamin tail domain-containing protein, partial [Bacteroidia bacterium]|nr:lamin tail domain-containing protein [Bacteroidia bacterium]